MPRLPEKPENNRQRQATAGISTWWASLRRRGVVRVAASYAMISWLLLQIVDVVLPPLGMTDGAIRVILILLVIGFPVALVLAWFFEMTPSGIVHDDLPESAARPTVTGARRYADILIIGALLIVVAFLLARQGGLIEEVSDDKPVVAILPFSNIGSAADNEYFGDGLADTMIQKLGQLEDLVVLASNSTFAFRGHDLNLGEVGGQLGASVIMVGSVQRARNALRINARLIDVGTGKQLWSGSFDRELIDVFAIQDEIANSVTEALHLVLTPASEQRLHAAPTTSLSAYDAYVLGQARMATRDEDDLHLAIDYFRKAITEDPDYALAYTGLTEALFIAAHRPWMGSSWAVDRAEAARAASQALALDPNLGEAYMANAQVALNDRDFGASEALPIEEIHALFQKAMDLSPNNAMVLKFYSELVEDDKLQLELLKQASRLDPRSAIIKNNIGTLYVRSGNYVEATDWFRRSAYSIEPYFGLGYNAINFMHMFVTGRPDESARWARARMQIHPEDSMGHLFYLRALLDLGAWKEASDALDKVSALAAASPQSNGFRWPELHSGMLLYRATGDLVTASETARLFSRVFLESLADWPVLEEYRPAGQVLTTLALEDIDIGRPNQALLRFQTAYPGNFERQPTYDLYQPPVMTAALFKQLGDVESAESLLQDYLAYVKTQPMIDMWGGLGFVEFTIHAFMGQKEEALAALKAALDLGYVHQWWMLKEASFDPDYARVIADPEFEALYSQIAENVDRMRAEFFAQPELPDGWMR